MRMLPAGRQRDAVAHRPLRARQGLERLVVRVAPVLVANVEPGTISVRAPSSCSLR
jgi:hypothetical protein